MRGPPPKSEGTPLGCFLKNWKLFKLDGLKKENLSFSVILPGFYIIWVMEKDGPKMGL